MVSRALAVVLAAILVPTALAAWSMEGGDAGRSGTTSAPIPTKDVALAWSVPGQFSGVVLAADGSIVATGDPVALIEPDGEVRWSTREVGEDKRVYRARGAGGILSDGTIVTAGHIGIASTGALVAYDPADGTQPWIVRDIGGSCDSTEDSHVAVGPDDTVYVGNCGPGVVAYLKDGTKKWSYDGSASRVALGGGNVYVSVRDHTAANGTEIERAILALSQADGSVVWIHGSDGTRVDPIVGGDGTIYYVGGTEVVALSPTDGVAKWTTTVPRPFALAIAPNGTVVAAGGSVVTWLAPNDGRILGQSPTRDGTHLVAGNGVHLRSYGNFLHAVDATGATLWEVTVPSRTFQSNLAIADDGTILLAEDGKLNAYRGAGGTSAPTTPLKTLPTVDDLPPAEPTSDAGEGSADTPAPGLALVLVVVATFALARPRR